MPSDNGAGNFEIVEKKAKLMIDRIIKLEKSNIQTKQFSDRDMVDRIKKIIREEESSNAD